MKRKQPLISIVVPTYNRSRTIEACIDSLLKQSYSEFELIICDDHSTDNTTKLVAAYSDQRIRLIRKDHNEGPAASRNEAIRQAQGDFIFFTDDDVIVPVDWLEIGLRHFNDPAVDGVEGRIVYVADGYKPHYSDRIVQNPHGGLYMTANIAYRKQVLLDAGLFDTDLRQYEDRTLAFKILETGQIVFAEDFVVTHQRETYSVRTFFGEASKVHYRIICLINFNDRSHFSGPFYEPMKFIVILFPPFLLARLRSHRFNSWRDWLLLLLAWPRLIYERGLIWWLAIKNKRVIL